MASAIDDARGALGALQADLDRRMREKPYPVLALGALAGYLAGGGLFSSWTRPLARAAMGALVVPGFREKLFGTAREFVHTQATA